MGCIRVDPYVTDRGFSKFSPSSHVLGYDNAGANPEYFSREILSPSPENQEPILRTGESLHESMNDLTQSTALKTAPSVRKLRILLADDHPLFRRGVAELIGTTAEFEVAGEAANPSEVLAKARDLDVDIALLDVSFHGTNGLELTKQMKAECPHLRIILLSMHDEQLYAIRALKSGAQGYVMKKENPETLLEALKKVAEGGIYVSQRVADTLVYRAIRADHCEDSPIEMLSDRELEVLQHFGEGRTTLEIANLLHLSAKTIETHRLHIKEKLGFRTAAELIRFAVNWVALQGGEKTEQIA